MLAERKQMFLVACDEDVRARFDGAGQNNIVASISCDRHDLFRSTGLRGRDPSKQPPSVADAMSKPSLSASTRSSSSRTSTGSSSSILSSIASSRTRLGGPLAISAGVPHLFVQVGDHSIDPLRSPGLKPHDTYPYLDHLHSSEARL